MSLGESIRKGTKWLLFGNLGTQVFQFAFGVALARLLVPADFGMIVTIHVFTGFAALAASGGMGAALVRSKTADEKDFQAVFTVQLMIGLLVYGLFFSMAPWFPNWFDNPLYTDLLRVSALSFLTSPFVRIHNAWLHRQMRFRERSIIRLITGFFTGATSVALALADYGVWSLTFGAIIGNVLNIILISHMTPLTPKLRFDIKRVRQFSGYGVKVSATNIIVYFRTQTTNLIISRLAGSSIVGLFNKADSLGTMPFSIISGSVYQPVFREMAKAQDNLDLTRYLFYKMISLLIVYTVPFHIGLAWVAEPFIATVYGDKWIAAAAPMQILALAGMLHCVQNSCGAVLAAQNRLGRELVVQTSTCVFVGIASYTGLKWGLVGVAWGILASHVYSTLLMLFLVNQCIKTRTSELFLAIAPGLFLNGILIAALGITYIMLPSYLISAEPVKFLVFTALVGGLAYGSAFLFLPIEALSSESLRWRKIFMLTR